MALVLFLLPSFLMAEQSALKASISQQFVQGFFPILIPLAEQILKGYNLGDFNFTITEFFTYDIYLTNSKLDNFTVDLAKSSISFVEPSNIQLIMNDLQMYLDSDFQVSGTGLDQKGVGGAHLKDTNMTLNIQLSITENKTLAISAPDPIVEIGGIDIYSPTLDPTVLQLLQMVINQDIATITEQVKETLQNLTVAITEDLSKLSYQFSYLGLTVDLHPRQAKVVNGFLCGGVRGAVLNPLNKKEIIPFESVDLPDIDPDLEFPIQLFLSEYVLKGAAVAISLIFDLSSSSYLPLTTSTIGFLIPQIPQMYGGDTELNIEISPVSVPDVRINNNVQMVAPVLLEFQVKENGLWKNVIGFNNTLTVALSGSLVDGDLKIDLETLMIELVNVEYVKDSKIQSFNEPIFKDIVAKLLEILKGEVNTAFDEFHITLPSILGFIQITGEKAYLKQQYGEIGANLGP